MAIIGSLAGHDQDNCVEISKDADLIPKIIGFASYRSDTMNTEAQQKVLLKSSLKVLQRLTSIDGEIGITLRYKISKHPFLLRNLTEILGHSMSSQEFKKLVAAILKNLAVDGNTRQEIGHIQPIITMLMQLFLSAEAITSTNADHSLQKVAGQALAVLTTESEHSCFVILKEPEFIKKLTAMILTNDDKYIYVAASLLRNLCLHAGLHLTQSDKKVLHHPLKKMFKRIMDMEGAELEILIGLSSQICEIVPDDFARELHNSQIKRAFVKRLVIVLNDGPSAHCPGIRRVILEQVICMENCNYQYADCFNEFRMIEALSTVEQTMSKDENYRIFLGNKGFMAYSMPISTLVAKAKNLWVVSRD